MRVRVVLQTLPQSTKMSSLPPKVLPTPSPTQASSPQRDEEEDRSPLLCLNAERLFGMLGENQPEVVYVSPQQEVSNVVSNPQEVTLHRGSTPATFPVPSPDFPNAPGNGHGVSMSILHQGCNPKMLEKAHENLRNACHGRYRKLLWTSWRALNPATRPDADCVQVIIGPPKLDRTYKDLIQQVDACQEASLRAAWMKVPVPFCYICSKNPFYPWAQLRQSGRNEFHYLLEVTESTPVDIVQAAATCSDGDWTPCPYMLSAAAEAVDLSSNHAPPGSTILTRTVWMALAYLLQSFSDGGSFIDVHHAWEICCYQDRMTAGGLSFAQQTESGLEKEARLAAFVELAIRCGFFADEEEERILDHDMALAFHSAPEGLRFAPLSLVALFDSAEHKHSAMDLQEFFPLSDQAWDFLKKLLKEDNLLETCKAFREKPDLNHWLETDWQRSGSSDPYSDPYLVSELLDRVPIPPAAAAGTATLMVSYISQYVSKELEDALQGSTEAQAAFAVVIEMHLNSKMGMRKDGKERATRFVTAVQSQLATPKSWSLQVTKSPSMRAPVTFGLLYVRGQWSREEVKTRGIELYNLMHTMNSAVWRIPASYLLWYLGVGNSFDLGQACSRGRKGMGPGEAQNWARQVLGQSREQFERANIRVKGEVLQMEKKGQGCIVIIAWDAELCEKALVSCGKHVGEQFVCGKEKWTLTIQ